jgi:ankyrin repeat protein
VVELLLTKGADVNSKTNEGGTALHEGKTFFCSQ